MSSSTLRPHNALPTVSRNTAIVISVVLFHIAVLWAMQSGLLRRVAEAVVPAEILVEIMAPPAPPTPEPKPLPQPKVQVKTPKAQPTPPAPTPVAAPQPAPTPLALAPSAVAPPPTSAAPTANAQKSDTSASTKNTSETAAGSAPATKTVDRSCIEANYLYNPKPPYPRISNRLRETGTVVLRISVGVDGIPQKIDLQQSSGFDRLDTAALDGVKSWRFTPCHIDGKPTATAFVVPLPFNLN
jgi:protein TonB